MVRAPQNRLPLAAVGATAKGDVDHGDDGCRHRDHVAGEGEDVQCLIHDELFLPLEAIGPAGTAYRHQIHVVAVVLGVLVCSPGTDVGVSRQSLFEDRTNAILGGTVGLRTLGGAVGGAGDQGQGDEEGPVHAWLSYLRALRRRHGGLTEQEIATGMGLTARSRVNHLLNHAPPRSKVQAGELLDALGALEWERESGLKLWELARNEHFGEVGSRSRRAVNRRKPSPLFAEIARSGLPTGGLRGRARELAELAAFCADEKRSYMWWQAEAWAGKTALLASFVVDPPSGIVPVSFFITGRLAGQDTSLAFLRDVTTQLEALSGTSQPEAVVRDGVPYLHWLLRECDQLMSKAGQRLVLVVDGLDEDMSRVVDRRSIASMLPKNLEYGSKVIVSGRPNPRLPGDTPADHPLWDPDIARVLSVSEHAIARRDIAAAELDQLLDSGSDLARNMVGYLVAARGGLSAQDMAELTGHLRRDVDKILNSAIGRTFAPRPVITTRGEQDPGFIFSHGMLSEEARSQLGTTLVREYREKLHQWANQYRDRGWPGETPFYLLRGYGEMLRQEHADNRFVALVTDGTRIDRMMDVTGSDADAAAEVGTALEFVASGGNVDLAAVALLAYQRDRLDYRNRSLPARLPAAWARAGQRFRAELLARSIGGGGLMVEALALVSVAFNDMGDKAGADRLKETACDELKEIDSAGGGYPRPAGAVAAALARAGEPARAQAVLADLEDARARDEELVEAAACMGRAGQAQQAEAIAATANTVEFQVIALSGAAEGLAVAGLTDQATRLAGQAKVLIPSVDNAYMRDAAIYAVTRAVAMTGQLGRAEELAENLSEPGARGEALAGIAAALSTPERRELAMRLIATAIAFFDEAETEARSRGGVSSFSRQYARHHLAQAYAGAGEVSAAEDLACPPYPASSNVDCLIGIAEKLACVGDAAEAERVLAKAETMARGGSPLRSLGEALINIARTLAALGAAGQAADILSDLETVATGHLQHEVSLQDLAYALAAAGAGERCTTVARSIDDPLDQKSVMAWSAELLAQAGHSPEALDLANSYFDPKDRPSQYSSVLAALAKAGDFDQAEKLADRLPDSDDRSRTLAGIAVERAAAGQWAAALTVVERIPDQQAQHHAIADIAPALARARRVDEALALTDIPDQTIRGKALAGIARSLAETGSIARGRHLTQEITHPWWRVTALAWIADAVAATNAQAQAEVLADADELLIEAQRADREAHARVEERGRLEGRPVIWLPSDARGTACWAASEAFARAGQTERAMQTAGLVPHPKSSRRALENVAVALAEAGHPEAATHLAATGSFRSPRAAVQARVAAALAREGHAKRAKDLLVTAIRTGRWDSWMPVLAEISRTDLLRLSECIRREFRLALTAVPD